MDDIWITECNYVRMSLLLGYTNICCKTGIKIMIFATYFQMIQKKTHIYTEIWLIIKLMNLGDRYMYYSFNSSTYFNTFKSLGEILHHHKYLASSYYPLLCFVFSKTLQKTCLYAVPSASLLFSHEPTRIRFLSHGNLQRTSS